MFINRWVIIRLAPPPKKGMQITTAMEPFSRLDANHHCYRDVFEIHIFCFFCWQVVFFLVIFFPFCRKSCFFHLLFVFLFICHKVIFFLFWYKVLKFFDKIHFLFFCFFYKVFFFAFLQVTFSFCTFTNYFLLWGLVDWFFANLGPLVQFDQNTKNNKGTTLFFVKKMKENKISCGKIDFLNN